MREHASQQQDRRKVFFYCLAAALPAMFVALLFNLPLALGVFVPGVELRTLGYIMQAEFLAASSGILMILPLLIPVRHPWLRWLRATVFVVGVTGTAWVAYGIDGTQGMLFYVLLVFVTYGGFTLAVFDWLSGTSRSFLSLLRWSMSIFVYVSLQLHFDLDSNISAWRETPAVVTFGASFFYVLLLLEIVLYPPLTWYLERRLVQERLVESIGG